jgi:hypothetical protein
MVEFCRYCGNVLRSERCKCGTYATEKQLAKMSGRGRREGAPSGKAATPEGREGDGGEDLGVSYKRALREGRVFGGGNGGESSAEGRRIIRRRPPRRPEKEK